MSWLLISTYDLGRQPFGLASAAAALRDAGVAVACADTSRDRLPEAAVRDADTVAFFLPMHTAARLAVPVIRKVRALNPEARLCAYGLYAPLNASLLRDLGVTTIVGAEFEDDLRRLARGEAPAPPGSDVPRVTFAVPVRDGLPALTRYASLQIDGESRPAAYTEASRGCKHRCRHCPIVPVYDGRFRVVPLDVVLGDIATQVEAGARHVTFGDPDFFNGIRHAERVMRAFADTFPGVSYDVTIKVEHLLQHRAALPVLRETGCVLITSAVESIDDEVLARLQKGHTREGFARALQACRDEGLALAPTFVAFMPWTSLDSYCDLLEEIERLDLVDHVAPIQLAIRLLVTEGSRLLELEEIRRVTGPFNPTTMTYPWVHEDPRVDALQQTIAALAGTQQSGSRRDLFARVWEAAHQAAGRPASLPGPSGLLARAAIPFLNEPWYC